MDFVQTDNDILYYKNSAVFIHLGLDLSDAFDRFDPLIRD